MTILILEIIYILIIYWITDFVLQAEKQLKEKSKNIFMLLQYVLMYSIVWFPAMLIFGNKFALLFIGIIFIQYFIINYFSSKINTKLWNDDKIHYFFINIGFDQLLHTIILILTFYILWINIL